jgi:hypothetical protein
MSRSFTERRHRILAIVLHPGVAGSAALDGFGLVPGSASTHRIARAREGVTTILTRAVASARPTHVVLGVSKRCALEDLVLTRQAMLALRAMGVPVVRRSIAAGEEVFGIPQHKGKRFHLGHAIVRNFFPHLRSRLPASSARESHLRPLWHAVLIALHELTRRAPRAAAALLVPGADLTPYLKYLAQCDRRRYHESI